MITEKVKDSNEKPIWRSISKETPIEDFDAMLNYWKEDLVENAIEGMKLIIIELIESNQN